MSDLFGIPIYLIISLILVTFSIVSDFRIRNIQAKVRRSGLQLALFNVNLAKGFMHSLAYWEPKNLRFKFAMSLLIGHTYDWMFML